MKKFLIFAFLLLTFTRSSSNVRDSIVYYMLPDSVKAITFMADFSVSSLPAKKEASAGIQTSLVKLFFEADKKERVIEFEFPANAKVMVTGIGVSAKKGELYWVYNWNENENYKLMIATAGDSVGNFSLYSGYVFLPKEKKWKLIGTCKIEGQWGTIKQPAVFSSNEKKTTVQIQVNESWCQRNSGSWKNLLQASQPNPVVNLLSHIDSLAQSDIEKKHLELLKSTSIATDKHYNESGGVYYSIMKEGNGKQVSIDDTVTVFYKGYLFSNNSVFDETKDKPASFPLKRLIAGWQIGVPLCKVGGKIKIIIPSGLAYSIRTRAAKIPPNSVLVFEIEVADAKSPQ